MRLPTKRCVGLLVGHRQWCHRVAQPKRFLLAERSGHVVLSTVQVRDSLKQLVGSLARRAASESDQVQSTPSTTSTSLPSLHSRRMTDSYREACIPLGRVPELRDKYVNFHNMVRFGRIMEDLDTMAVWISYTHHLGHIDHGGHQAEQKCGTSIVTALVDSIQMNAGSLVPDCDIVLRGHPSWVGNTSIEVSMEVDQKIDGCWYKMMDAKFLMVARDPVTKGKVYLCPLDVSTEEEKAIFQEGEANKQKRQEDKVRSLLKIPPNNEESLLIHEMFRKTLEDKAATFKHPVKPSGSVWMEDTMLKNVHVCFPEDRNLYNKIFGGFLMRLSFELAWANAYVYCGTRPISVAVDDIMFRKPVEVGSLLFLSSQIVYTQGPYMQVKVHAEVVSPQTGAQDTTNIFHYTYRAPQGSVPELMPKSYAEYMMYIDGKRHFDEARLKTE